MMMMTTARNMSGRSGEAMFGVKKSGCFCFPSFLTFQLSAFFMWTLTFLLVKEALHRRERAILSSWTRFISRECIRRVGVVMLFWLRLQTIASDLPGNIFFSGFLRRKTFNEMACMCCINRTRWTLVFDKRGEMAKLKHQTRTYTRRLENKQKSRFG
jgi:hypothetical protein